MGSYENRHYYNSVFDAIAFFTHDFKVLATRDFVWNKVTFTPTGAFTYRYSETPNANKYFVLLGLDVEVPITERTSIVGGPTFPKPLVYCWNERRPPGPDIFGFHWS